MPLEKGGEGRETLTSRLGQAGHTLIIGVVNIEVSLKREGEVRVAH